MSKFTIPAKQPLLEMAANERRYFESNGYWLCLGCKVPVTEIENLGEHNQCCQKCKSITQWIPPVEQRAEARGQRSEVRDQRSEIGADGKVRHPRTSEIPVDELSNRPAKMSLTEAAFKGFYTCTACGHIVQVVNGECGQCGSEKVIWNKPVLGAEIVEEAQGKPKEEVKAAA